MALQIKSAIPTKSGEGSSSSSEPSSPSAVNVTDKQVNGSSSKAFSAKKYSGKGIPVTRLSSCMDGTQSQQDYSTRGGTGLHTPSSKSKGNDANGDSGVLERLRKENRELKQRLEAEKDRATSADLEQDLQREKDRSKLLETQVQTAQEKIEEMSREQETLIRIFSEERERRDNEEATLRKKLQDASSTIQLLLEKVRELEAKKSGNLKSKR
ncbi:hypothetical protein D8674_029390 [Pyrus ussuriensis x Pyrus communis]|uniref:Uncharacterized protein n=1 Tax=Pyrus ussuriensis x Pyrus communis TaxID=2448454 RepID=A0A5N5I1Y5_9ROSA|nr:hypothetical protein D8674_029390 [Pyrus ussuriensis x Pyrus communis]